MKFVSTPRFLAVYSGVVTAVFAITVFSGFDTSTSTSNPKFDQITVQRINVVEPDGTLRMVISNKARVPGIYVKGKEYLKGSRDTAGIIFLNNEGSENGGLTFSGAKDSSGNVSNSGHLSFDQYLQDQTFAIDASQFNDQRISQMQMIDRPDWDITELLKLLESIANLPPDEQQAKINEFLATHPAGERRILLGRNTDKSVALQLKDLEGRNRVVLKVDPDGTPHLQFLDASGNVVSQYPQ